MTDDRDALVRIETKLDMALVRANDHEERLRTIEAAYLTKEEIVEAIASAISAAARPAWRDIGAIVVTTGAGAALMTTLFAMRGGIG